MLVTGWLSDPPLAILDRSKQLDQGMMLPMVSNVTYQLSQFFTDVLINQSELHNDIVLIFTSQVTSRIYQVKLSMTPL